MSLYNLCIVVYSVVSRSSDLAISFSRWFRDARAQYMGGGIRYISAGGRHNRQCASVGAPLNIRLCFLAGVAGMYRIPPPMYSVVLLGWRSWVSSASCTMPCTHQQTPTPLTASCSSRTGKPARHLACHCRAIHEGSYTPAETGLHSSAAPVSMHPTGPTDSQGRQL